MSSRERVWARGWGVEPLAGCSETLDGRRGYRGSGAGVGGGERVCVRPWLGTVGENPG